MNIIVAVDSKWGIGRNNGLLFNIPEDMNYFRTMTKNKVVCMGYNTLLSLPDAAPLKNRINIVLAPQGVEREDLIVVYSLNELFTALENYDDDDVFVIGGGMFYKTMLPYVKNVYVTEVYSDGKATVFFENLSENSDYLKTYLSEIKSYKDIKFRFVLYENLSPKVYSFS